MKLTHVLITNMTYMENDPVFDWRLSWYQSMVFPRLLRQTDQFFDIAVKCNPIHAEKFKEINKRIITFYEKPEMGEFRSERIFQDSIKFNKKLRKFCEWKNIVGLKEYDIQSSLDSDDLISEHYIKKIKQEVLKEDLFKPLHIHFQPELFDVWNLKIYKMNFKYSREKGSAFYSLYQPPNRTNYIFIRDDSHIRMAKYANKSILIPEGYCWISIHGMNYSYKNYQKLIKQIKKT